VREPEYRYNHRDEARAMFHAVAEGTKRVHVGECGVIHPLGEGKRVSTQ